MIGAVDVELKLPLQARRFNDIITIKKQKNAMLTEFKTLDFCECF
jgi:hypothetical protein